MAQALPIAALVLSTAGPVVEGIGARKEYRAAARVDEENARLSVLAGEQEVADLMREERAVAGDAVADMASSGLLIGGGSAQALLRESSRQLNRAVVTRREQAASEQANYLQAAKDKRRAGRNALISGIFSAASNAIAGASGMNAQAGVSAARGRVRSASLGGGA